MSATSDTVGTIATSGGLWGGPLLAALQNESGKLPGTKPADYGLPPGLDLRDAARGTWTILKAAWADFDAQRRHRAEHLDTEWYGTDNFTLTRWLHHLLDQLGYHGITPVSGLAVDGADTDDPGDTYPITHLWNDRVPLHLLPAGVPLDKTTLHVPGAARQSPHSTMQDYLNRTDRHMWGIATNGLTLRLLRNNAALTRQAYVEFDLATMFADDNYADFAVLWLAVHATRFAGDTPADCVAEQWQQHAAETGVRALDALRGGVEAAIEQIGQGLVEHPENKTLRGRLETGELDGQALYRQLLYVAYRHVFLFAVEDRDLLHPPDADPQHVATYRRHYSTRRLRDQARRHLGGQHPDGWEIHKTITAALANPDGQHLLALPPVLGSLWDTESTPDLADAVLTNRRYYAALRNLALVQRDGVTHRVDYRGMGSDELGAVYEALLEVNATASATARTFELSRTAGNERKTTGSYYTPTSLIARVLDDALDPVVARAIKGKDGTDAADAILQLTVCDPAMGSAHFLTGAAHRLAKHVAANRTGQTEPSPGDYRDALRDVVSRCIYGVDVNPMAVQLAKTALWLECHVPGKPLTFLDHHLKCGNALLGVGLDASLIDWTPPQGQGDKGKGGVPDAAFKALHGDDSKAASRLKKANRSRRDGVASLLASGGMHDDPTSDLATQARGIAFMDDDTPEELEAKQQAWMLYGEVETLQREKLRADAWTACWTMPKASQQVQADDQPFDVYYDCHYNGLPADTRPGVEQARSEAATHRFFHWGVEFPEIANAGGFSVMVGNPPWERVKIQQQEWFANRGRDDIADAAKASDRNNMIQFLYTSVDSADSDLATAWDHAQHESAAVSEFVRKSGRFPWGGVGDVNLYALFADHNLASHSRSGAAGFICPTGLATGATYSDFFGHLVESRRLKSFWSMWNHDRLFPTVNDRVTFALVTFVGENLAVDRIGFTGYVWQTNQIDDSDRGYTLTADEISSINPNTRTAPLFRHAHDATVVATMHRKAGALLNETRPPADPAHNPWGIRFLRMFDMANDSGLFRGHVWAQSEDAQLVGNTWVLPSGARAVPLYEGKLIWFYNHRAGTYEGQTEKQARVNWIPSTTLEQRQSPRYLPQPAYWVEEKDVDQRLEDRWDRGWFLGWRDVARATDERTLVVSVIPRAAVGHKLPLMLPGCEPSDVPVLLAALASFVVDFRARNQADSGMAQFVMRQLPVAVDPDKQLLRGTSLRSFVAPRVAELSYTASDLGSWAQDIGYGGPPFRWEVERREILGAELDAAFFLLYGLSREDVGWVLESFESLAGKQRRAIDKGGHGEFRTKRLVLERYDAMVKAGEGESGYETPLVPPPGDDAMRHAHDHA